jgi:hypothetical protein
VQREAQSNSLSILLASTVTSWSDCMAFYLADMPGSIAARR